MVKLMGVVRAKGSLDLWQLSSKTAPPVIKRERNAITIFDRKRLVCCSKLSINTGSCMLKMVPGIEFFSSLLDLR